MDWRKRVGVEPTVAILRRRPPVLKTGAITGSHALPCRKPNALAWETAMEIRRSCGVGLSPIPFFDFQGRY